MKTMKHLKEQAINYFREAKYLKLSQVQINPRYPIIKEM